MASLQIVEPPEGKLLWEMKMQLLVEAAADR